MSSSPFLGAKFANGKHNSEFTIQTRGNEFAPISGTFFIAFWKCRPRAQHLPLIEDPHEIFNKNKSMRNFPSELGNQFLQNVWQLKILSKKIRGMLLIVLKDKVKSIERGTDYFFVCKEFALWTMSKDAASYERLWWYKHKKRETRANQSPWFCTEKTEKKMSWFIKFDSIWWWKDITLN